MHYTKNTKCICVCFLYGIKCINLQYAMSHMNAKQKKLFDIQLAT